MLVAKDPLFMEPQHNFPILQNPYARLDRLHLELKNDIPPNCVIIHIYILHRPCNLYLLYQACSGCLQSEDFLETIYRVRNREVVIDVNLANPGSITYLTSVTTNLGKMEPPTLYSVFFLEINRGLFTTNPDITS